MDTRKQSNIWRTAIGCMSMMLLQLNSAYVNADGLETLGPPSVSIASGTGIVVSGVGLAESQPGSISIDIPLTATVKQVLLYWEGYQAIPPGGLGVTNTDITVNGAPVTGVLIGGPLSFENNLADSAAYRADITDMGLVGPGANSLSIGGMNFTKTNHGAGILVIIDDSLANPAVIDLRDGNDFAYGLFVTEVQMTTVPQTFTFTSSPDARTANLELMFASVFGTASSGGTGIFRPTAIEVSVDGGPPTVFDNLLDSIDGQEWDSIAIDVPIPAGATSVTVEAQSVDNGAGIPDGTTRGDVASFHWISAGLSVTPPPPPERPTRTLGYWKNHPTVINGEFSGAASLLPLTFCGETIKQDEVCEAVDFLRSRGGGINNFKRQGMAALLNCEAFGCSSDIRDLIEAGSLACDADYPSYDFGTPGSTLDEFNNSGDYIKLPFQSPSAQPKYCNTESDKKAHKGKKGKKGKKWKKGKKGKKKAKK